jgi:heme a synthase
LATERRRLLVRRAALLGAGLMLAVTTLSAFVRLANIGLDGAPEPDAVLLARGAHRIAASTVLLVVLGLLALSLGPRPYLQREGRHAIALLALTVFLAVLGRWSGGSAAPAVTLGNLLGGFLVFALCWRLALPEARPLDARLQQFAGLAAAVLLLQVSFGALGLAVHPYSGLVVLLVLASLGAALWRVGQRQGATALLALLAAQLALGLLNPLTGAALGVVLAHNIIALLLLAGVLRFVRLPLLGDEGR